MKKNGIFFSGDKLIGNNYNLDDIKEWFDDEKEAYYDLNNKNENGYEYLKFNHFYTKNYVKEFKNILGFGAGKGQELQIYISDKTEKIIIIDSSVRYKINNSTKNKIKFVKSHYSGKIDAPDNSFDLITCFGVLHHIPNVEFVISEFSRILKNDGLIFLREPIVSMGDWTKKRKGLTIRERGIPIKILEQFMIKSKFNILSNTKTTHGITSLLSLYLKYSFNSTYFGILMDKLFCKYLSFFYKYHTTNKLIKLFRASNTFIIAKLES